MNQIVQTVRNNLIENSDEKTKKSFQRFFKEKVMFHGVKSNLVGKVAKESYKEILNLDKKEIFKLAEELFKSGFCEEAWVAANWVHQLKDKYEIDDIKIYENWIDKYIDNWAECDGLCNHSVGSFIDKFPSCIDVLKTWAKSKNLWLRRASAVTLIIAAKEGRYLSDIFEIADILLMDKEDMVQKGYGWMLKEASRKHQKEIFDYVVKHKDKMPRTALRYAIEKMPENLRKEAMKK